MNFHRSWIVSSALILFFLLSGVRLAAAEDQETGIDAPAEVKTGIVQIESVQPVFLYVPARYKAARAYPLIISLPEDSSVEKHLNDWSSIAERSSFIVLTPSVAGHTSDLPYAQDKWLIQIRKDLGQHYNLAQNKVLLIGNGASAHYAAYLGVTYPKQFSGLGLINGAWKGQYSALMQIKDNLSEQLPIYFAVDESDVGLVREIEAAAAELQKAGYLVHVEKARGEEIPQKDLKAKAVKWLFDKSDAWQDHIKKQKKSWKEKVSGSIKNNFFIES